MGAIVTVRLKPGQDPERIKAILQSELQSKTGQNVSINVAVRSQYQAKLNEKTPFNSYIR